jgi:predicted transcriptional regulator
VTHPGDVLLSLHAPHVARLLSGRKSVELRKRALNIAPESRVWIYGTRPLGSIQAVAMVRRVERLPPAEIWRLYGQQTGISRDEFSRYFDGVAIGSAMLFDRIKAVIDGPTLDCLRSRLGSFQPPQFFKRLGSTSPELALLEAWLNGDH